MNIYRFQVKDDLYFLNDTNDYFFKTLKLSIENNWIEKGTGIVRDNIAFEKGVFGYDKLGTIINKKLMEKYSEKKEEKKKEEDFISYDSSSVWNAWANAYDRHLALSLDNGIIGSLGVDVTTTPSIPLQTFTSCSTVSIDAPEEARVEADRERNRQTVRSYIDIMNRNM